MKFSVVTINFNNRDGLYFTLRSVANQTFKDKECIVIDGGSTDGSLDVIQSFSETVDYYVSERDSGVYNAMNKAIRHSRGEWVIFMNSGDRFHSSSVLEDVAKDCSADIIVGSTNRCVRKSLTEITDVEELLATKEITASHIFKYGFNHQSSFIKTELLRRNPYDETLKIVSDWKFFVEELVLNNRSYQSIPTIIADYDISGMSSNPNLVHCEKQKVLRSILSPRIYNDYQVLMYGETDLDKILLEMGHDCKAYRLITIIAKLIRKSQLIVGRISRSI